MPPGRRAAAAAAAGAKLGTGLGAAAEPEDEKHAFHGKTGARLRGAGAASGPAVTAGGVWISGRRPHRENEAVTKEQ